MLLKEFKQLLEQYDENLEVIYAKDAEGNGFDRIYFEPTIGKFDEDTKDFIQFDEDDEISEDEVNSICIN